MKCQVKCPFHGHIVETTISWAKLNKRIYCDTCGKAFDISVEEEYDKTEENEEDDEVSNVDAEGYW